MVNLLLADCHTWFFGPANGVVLYDPGENHRQTA